MRKPPTERGAGSESTRFDGAAAATPAPANGEGDDGERRRIMQAMADWGGNQTLVASKLGMARGTLIARQVVV